MMSTFITAVCLIGALCWGTAAATDSVQEGNGTPDLKLLFVGNSLLYYNGGAYKVVAGLLHDRFPSATIQADQVVGPNFLLSQHLQQAQTPGTAQYQTLAADSKDHWDAVIFQEESQQVALGGDTDSKSLDALKQLAKLAAARGAKVGVDLTWAWLDGKNPDFPDFKQMQAKVNSGYAANLKDLIAADGIPAFIAPVGLGWLAVDELVDAAKSGAPALVEAEPDEESARLSMLAQSATAGQSAPSLPAASPLASPGVSLQTLSVKQICQQSAAVEGALSPAQAPLPAAMAPSLGAAQAAPAPGVAVAAPMPAAQARQATGAAQQLPMLLAGAPASHVPATVASLPFVAGRRLQAAARGAVPGLRAASGQSWRAEALLPAAAAARRLLEPQSKEAAVFIYGAEAEAPAASPATAPSPEAPLPGVPAPAPAPSDAEQEEAAKEGTSEGAPAPANAAAPSPAESPEGSSAPAHAPSAEEEAKAPASEASAPSEGAPSPAESPADPFSPADAPSPLRAALVEEEPTLEHESVTMLKGAAAAPAPAEDAAVEGSTGGLCAPSALPAGTNTFAEMYASDGNHPSNAGTYLEGLIIASSITGCRMKGNGFTFGLEPKWYTFLQELSDAIVFEATPAQFPPYPWSSTGPKCALKP